ncbi:hypothetical protein BP5796_02182 [Coleophoma crateriformis]|uniref:Uncharacterized protein n=1 Tax=Coleophoma crateriformis TaxID=565419 RepID=A0A3D8SXG2_9HELO|nr:hypothetical protein BP5796_02182 [Coleophoma crateriformis]
MAQDHLCHALQRKPMGIRTKCEILNSLWGLNVQPTEFYDKYLEFDAYFAYYAEECDVALHDGGRHILARTHRDIVEIAQHLKNSSTRSEIKQFLRNALPSPIPTNADELLDGSIDLAARLLLMLGFGRLRYGFSGKQELVWSENSLGEFVSGYFATPPALRQERVKLERVFNARNLGRIAGIKIEWTKNLADHLLLVEDDMTVSIFHYASFLECQKNSQIFPDGFVEETLRTLALLFPQTDRDTRNWFRKQSSIRNIDSKAMKCGRLRMQDRRIESFYYWHDRLVDLKQFFDEAEPSTISQWWFDRRKRVQWYTFWVAALVLALTVIFGLVQCVEGGLQAYKAYHPSH